MYTTRVRVRVYTRRSCVESAAPEKYRTVEKPFSLGEISSIVHDIVIFVCVIFVARQAYDRCTVRLCQFEGNTC